MFDGIPLRGTGRIVSDGDSDAEAVAYPSLDFRFPEPGIAAVAASAVGENQKFWCAAIVAHALPFPPGSDGMCSEGGRVVGDADADGAAIAAQVINPVGDSYSAGIGEEVVIVYQDRRTIPFGAAISEITDHFAFLGIHADAGEALPLESMAESGDALELLIAIGAGVGSDLLAIHAQREVHVAEKTSDRIGRNRNIDLLQDCGDLLGGFASPLQTADGIPGGIVLQKNFDRVDYFGRFFSTGLRPPPILRARSISTS